MAGLPRDSDTVGNNPSGVADASNDLRCEVRAIEELPLNGRQRRLWRLHDFTMGRGLEIAPLHNVAVPRAHADVQYLDVFDRATLIERHASDANVDTTRIPEIDFVLHDGEHFRSIPDATAGAGPFQWVMASHVIEHVPDLIGWLDEVAQITADGGRLVLAVPDRRYCFDVHRPGTTVGQILQAHELGETVPSIRAVYDSERGHVATDPREVWAGRPPGYEARSYTLDFVQEQVARARAGAYIDAHVWTFTPGTFLEQVIELRELGLSEWALESWRPTLRNELEFYAVLQRLPRQRPWSPALFDTEPSPKPRMPDWLEEWAYLRTAVDAANAKAQRRRDRLRAVERRLQRTHAWVMRLPEQFDAVHTSWRRRTGRIITRLADAIRRRVWR
jgi:SAM-dependent methyltransferase